MYNNLYETGAVTARMQEPLRLLDISSFSLSTVISYMHFLCFMFEAKEIRDVSHRLHFHGCLILNVVTTASLDGVLSKNQTVLCGIFFQKLKCWSDQENSCPQTLLGIKKMCLTTAIY